MKILFKKHLKYYGNHYKKLLENNLITECMCDSEYEEPVDLVNYNSSTNRILYKINNLGKFVVADDLSILAAGKTILKDALKDYLYKKIKMKYSLGMHNGSNYVMSNAYSTGRLIMPEEDEEECEGEYPEEYFEPDDRSEYYQSPIIVAINKFKNRNYDEVY